jgi:DUF4097 and DUF4098 domain-containing protein YvlB
VLIRPAVALAFTIVTCSATPVLAQRFPFEQRFDARDAAMLDVSTVRGQIDVEVGPPGQVLVTGTVTVRIGWNVPTNAVEIARRLADKPPIERAANTFRLRPPTDATDRRAVTVAYQVRVPPDTTVLAVSESGETTVRGVSGPVTVRTQSAAIELTDLGGTAGVVTGSGAVTIDGVAGLLTIRTSSSAIRATSLAGGVRVRTMSGSVDAALTGTGDVDVETQSSAIQVRGARGGVHAATQSGRVTIQGAPGAPWDVATGSGAIDLDFAPSARFTLNASTRSGSVRLEGVAPTSESKGRATATAGAGGPTVGATSRSGSIRITAQ